MQETVQKNEHSGLGNRALDLQTETRDILLLHYKQGMSFSPDFDNGTPKSGLGW